ncbi:MAG: hypothetical protein ACP5NS_02190 [Candidatus Pacearchaeota archaeon]
MVMVNRSKKGDVTISTVILIVLGLAVLVMLIVGFTKGWSFFFDLFDSGPSQLQTVAKACVGYAQGSLTIDFCKYRLIEENGNDELINCRDSRILASLAQDGIDTTKNSLSCSGNNDETRRVACTSLASGKPETKIDGPNGSTCASVLASGPSGTTLINCPSTDGNTAVSGSDCMCGTITTPCTIGKKCNTLVEPDTCN